MVISTVELLKTDVMPCQRRIFTRIDTWIPCTCPPQQKLLSLSFQSDVAVSAACQSFLSHVSTEHLFSFVC